MVKSKFQKTSKGNLRQWKNVGLGFKTPKSAIDNNYVDKKCPWTGNVSIRGRIIRGVVRSVKMSRTLVVRRDYLHWVTKYQRYEKRHQNFAAHVSPAFVGQRVCTLPCVFSSHISKSFFPQVGDEVVCGQCRPLSKTVRFNVLKVNPKGKQRLESRFKKFAKF